MMKSIAKSESAYTIKYHEAPWIVAMTNVGVFVTLCLKNSDDEIFYSNFTQGEQGEDELVIGINCGSSGVPVLRPWTFFPIYPGGSEISPSLQLCITLVNASDPNAEPFAKSVVKYGGMSYMPLPDPLEMFMFKYASAAFGILRNRDEGSEVFVVVNVDVYEGDEIKPVFTANGGEDDYDLFELDITSKMQGKVKRMNKVFGPYVLTDPKTTGLKAGTKVNGKPAQKPVGIKSYGNDEDSGG